VSKAPAAGNDHGVTAEAELLYCPMCEYDLRGQIEPRCSECGYRFDWDELRDPTRRLHPYLFEHHAERNVWSWWRTLTGALRPRRFWRLLHPSQPSRPRRLAIYLLIIVLIALVPLLLDIVDTYLRQSQWWAMRGARLRNVRGVLPPPLPTFTQLLPLVFKKYVLVGLLIRYIFPILWVGLTFASLLIFQISMHRARIRDVHMARCVVYGADVLIWTSVFIAGTAILNIAALKGVIDVGVAPDLDFVIALLSFTAWVVFVYRLRTALLLYARFDHPTGTVLATQVIALLAIGCVFFNVVA
jgi:hypothetical protein